MAVMGRPKKEIDKKEFESLLAIQCTLAEVAAFFDHKLDGCSEDTIERWCKRTYKQTFAEVSAVKKEYGKISLRRYQLELAKKSAAMAIFLGKNWLGQVDSQRIETRSDGALAELIEGLKDTDVNMEILETGKEETEKETQGKDKQ